MNVKVKKRILRYIKNLKKIKKSFSNKLYLSIGENCLADDILSRYGLKSFSTPFAAGRMNIEYLLDIVKSDYEGFLDIANLEYGVVNEKKVVRLKNIDIHNQYDESCMKGFEFTHYDVIDNDRDRATIARRVQRIKNIKNKEVYFLYHHRYCQNTDFELLITGTETEDPSFHPHVHVP